MSLIRKGAVVFLSVIISIKCGDLLVGKLSPETLFPIEDRGLRRSINLLEINPNFKAKYVPTKAYLETTDSLERRTYIVETDKNGFIKNGNNIDFKDTDETIIFFGGSTTEQAFVPQKSRWQSIIERRLNAKNFSSTKFRVVNAGVSGTNILHSTLSFLAKGVPLNPKFVVLMHNSNDYALLRLSGSYWKAPEINRSYKLIINLNHIAICSET